MADLRWLRLHDGSCHGRDIGHAAPDLFTLLLQENGGTHMTVVPALLSSASNEWFTPADYVEAARYVMGGTIALDPASCPEANATVQAKRIFTIDDDGLSRPWVAATVFLNPPYGRRDGTKGPPNAKLWTEKCIAEWRCGNVNQALILVNASTSERWFWPLWQFPLCFTDHRIRFATPDGIGASPTKGSVFVYLPPEVHSDYITRFAFRFDAFGQIVLGSWPAAYRNQRPGTDRVTKEITLYERGN